MIINLLYGKGTSGKLWCILESHKIKSTFYIENTLRKLLYKPKALVATEDKNSIIYEMIVITAEQFTSVNQKGF